MAVGRLVEEGLRIEGGYLVNVKEKSNMLLKRKGSGGRSESAGSREPGPASSSDRLRASSGSFGRGRTQNKGPGARGGNKGPNAITGHPLRKWGRGFRVQLHPSRRLELEDAGERCRDPETATGQRGFWGGFVPKGGKTFLVMTSFVGGTPRQSGQGRGRRGISFAGEVPAGLAGACGERGVALVRPIGRGPVEKFRVQRPRCRSERSTFREMLFGWSTFRPFSVRKRGKSQRMIRGPAALLMPARIISGFRIWSKPRTYPVSLFPLRRRFCF